MQHRLAKEINMYQESLIEVSPAHILLAAAPLVGVAVVSYHLDLNLESSILIGSFRTFVQLSILSFILDPIFKWGVDLWWVVVAYTIFMILLASFESSSRSFYFFDGMFGYVLGSILFNVTLVALFAFPIILDPSPVWDPQYVIPIVGMLLGNCINGISLSLNSMLTGLVDCAAEIELMLAFGASPYEASSRLLKESIRTGTMPTLNSMAIIGIISIPGMMTGQILGGSSVADAARYQILIMYLIATCSFGTILTQLFFSLRICFDANMILRSDRLMKRTKRRNITALVDIVYSSVRDCLSRGQRDSKVEAPAANSKGESTMLQQGKLKVSSKSTQQVPKVMRLVGLGYSFQKKGSVASEESGRRTLFEDLSFEVCEGQAVVVEGPSGTGKSTLLRILAGLTTIDAGEMFVDGQNWFNWPDKRSWRNQVLYVPQTWPDIPGTPATFIERVSCFRSWSNSKPHVSEMLSAARTWVAELGLHSSAIDSEWKKLSGGEAQRVMVAIALASKPRIVLLDECTSALDVDSKLRVEKLIFRQAQEAGLASVWITHDEDQKQRIR